MKNQSRSASERPRVIVCGRNYCTNLWLSRSIGAAGYDVEVFRILRIYKKWTRIREVFAPEARSRYVKRYHAMDVGGEKPDVGRLIEALCRIGDPDRRALLLPTDDWACSIADEHYDALSRYYLIPNVRGKAGELVRLMSKSVQKELASAAGLPVVPGRVISSENGEFTIPDSVFYPCFVKPNVSRNGAKIDLRRCDSAEELERALKSSFETGLTEALVEDCVDIRREYSLLGLCTKDGTVGPGFFAAEKGGHRERRGVALTGIVLSPSAHRDLVDKLVRFMDSLGYEGLFDIDLIEGADGKLYFTEVNLRYGGSGCAITRAGANLPGMFADYMLKGKPVDPGCAVSETGRRFVSEKILLDEYTHGCIDRAEAKACLESADYRFIRDEDDPAPYRAFRRMLVTAPLLKLYYRIKERRGAAE